MIRINLLPWRETRQRERRIVLLLTLAAGATVAAALLGSVHLILNGAIHAQEQRNLRLEEQVSILNQTIAQIRALESQKNRVMARTAIIERLQSSRPETVRLFNELARTIPEGVRLQELIQNAQVLQVKGLADSNAQVSSLMQRIEASPLLESPELTLSEKSTPDGDVRIRFDLKFRLGTPPPGTRD